jgi:hypothetical protein
LIGNHILNSNGMTLCPLKVLDKDNLDKM